MPFSQARYDTFIADWLGGQIREHRKVSRHVARVLRDLDAPGLRDRLHDSACGTNFHRQADLLARRFARSAATCGAIGQSEFAEIFRATSPGWSGEQLAVFCATVDASFARNPALRSTLKTAAKLQSERGISLEDLATLPWDAVNLRRGSISGQPMLSSELTEAVSRHRIILRRAGGRIWFAPSSLSTTDRTLISPERPITAMHLDRLVRRGRSSPRHSAA